MSFQKPQNRLPLFLIIFALITIFGLKFFLLLLFVGFFLAPLVLSSSFLKNIKKQWANISREGFDISKFQSAHSQTKTNKTNKFTSFSSFFRSPMNDFQLRGHHIFGVLVAAVLIFLVIDGFVNIPPGHVGVVYDRGRGVLDEELPEGLKLKIPFWQTVTKMDTRLQAYTMSVAEGEGQIYGKDAIEALTKDGQTVNIDVTIQYRIEADQAASIFQKVGIDYEAKIIRPEVRSVVREITTRYESKELFSIESRQKASREMEQVLRESYAKKNITLEALLLRNVQFSNIYLSSIEEKQVAEQKIQKAEFERQEAEKRKERIIIEAQADAEAIRLKGQALAENPEVIQLEFINKMAPSIKWGILPDGALPLIDVKDLQQ